MAISRIVTALLLLLSLTALAPSALSEDLPPEIEQRLHAGSLARAVWSGDLDKVKRLIDLNHDVDAIGGLDGTYGGLSSRDCRAILQHMGRSRWLKDFVASSGALSSIHTYHDGDLTVTISGSQWNGYSVYITGYDDYSGMSNLSPLAIAVLKGYWDIAEILVLAGASIDSVSADGKTTMTLAVESGNVLAIDWLVDHGARLNSHDTAITSPLAYAAAGGHNEAVEALIRAGSDLENRDNEGWTALMHAAANGASDVCRTLVESGAQVGQMSRKGETALMLAVRSGSPGIVEYLTRSAGASLETADHRGFTALIVACESCQDSIALDILEMGGDATTRTSNGMTALMLATSCGNSALVSGLLERGSDPLSRLDDGTSALHLAAEGGFWSICESLLESGADIDAQNSEGRSALMCAAKSNHDLTARNLVDQGADVDLRDQAGMTALMCAAQSNAIEVVDRLIEAGVRINATSDDNMTALMYSVASGCNSEVSMELLRRGARRSTKDIEGRSTYDFAKRNRCTEVARRLNWADGSGLDFLRIGYKPGLLSEIALGMGLEVGLWGKISLTHETYYVLVDPEQDIGQGPSGQLDLIPSLRMNLNSVYERVRFYCRGGFRVRQHLNGFIGSSTSGGVDFGVGVSLGRNEGRKDVSVELRYVRYLSGWWQDGGANGKVALVLGLGV